MKLKSFWKGCLLLAGVVLAVAPAKAQERRGMAVQNAASHSVYDLSREVSVQGTVVSYTDNSPAAPLGAHVLIQTGAGNTIDVGLGDARLLKQNHLEIAAGNSVRVIGETLPYGDDRVFVARLVQLGTQVVALRATNGMPIVFAGNRGKARAQANTQQGGPR